MRKIIISSLLSFTLGVGITGAAMFYTQPKQQTITNSGPQPITIIIPLKPTESTSIGKDVVHRVGVGK